MLIEFSDLQTTAVFFIIVISGLFICGSIISATISNNLDLKLSGYKKIEAQLKLNNELLENRKKIFLDLFGQDEFADRIATVIQPSFTLCMNEVNSVKEVLAKIGMLVAFHDGIEKSVLYDGSDHNPVLTYDEIKNYRDALINGTLKEHPDSKLYYK